MASLSEIRAQYPQYSDMSDQALADALYTKNYSDMPRADFDKKLGIAPKAAATPSLPFGQQVKETAKGAIGEVGKQAMGVVNLLGEMGERASGLPTDTNILGETAQGVAETASKVARHPIREAVSSVTDWMEKALPTPKTPEQAQERGAAFVRGAEAVIPGAQVAKDVVELGGMAGARAVAGTAEKIAAKGEAKAAEASAAGQAKNDLIRDVRALDLRLTPQQAGGSVGRVAAAAAGRPQLEREISLYNAEKAKAAAAKDVGIKEPLSRGSVSAAINETMPKYTAPRKLGRVNLGADEKWKTDLNEIRGVSAQESVDFPEDFNAKLEKEIQKFDKPSADADTLVTKIRKLRERASDNFRAGNAEDVELARAQRKLATSMEEAIERHGEATGQGKLIKDFRDARVRLAKLYTLRDSLTETGELDLGELQRRLDKGEPLTGNLKTLAQAKSAFDRSFQNPEKIREHPVGALDIALGATAGLGKFGAAAAGAGTAGAAVLPAAAAVAARPVTRAIIGSRPYQAATIKPRVPKPSMAAREARKIAEAAKRGPTLEELRRQKAAAPPTVSDATQ